MKLILIMVMSLNGIVAFDENTDIRKYSSDEDHSFFLQRASQCDAAVMGRFSYNSEIPCKRKYLLSHHIKQEEIEDNSIIISGSADEVYKKLKIDGNHEVALLGGPRTNSAFLSAGLVDEIYLTIEPVILGEGLTFSVGELNSVWNMTNSIRLNDRGTIVLHYQKGKTVSDSKWRRILSNGLFQSTLEQLSIVEKERKFCNHDLTHLLDTARVMYITNLECGYSIQKDLIYGAGLLHDIGRLRQYIDGTPHDEAGIPIAEKILKNCGYSQEEITEILDAISLHRHDEAAFAGEQERLAALLYHADKKCRLCFQCNARKECNRSEEKQNKEPIC